MAPPKLGLILGAAMGAVTMALSACALPSVPPVEALYGGPRPTGNFAPIPYATWSDDEPGYRMYPGDVLDVAVPSAIELNRTVTVQPDGRITLPMIPAAMAADRSVPDLNANLTALYATQLRRPDVEVTVKTATPLKVFVGGEVDKPGVYDMPGDINALQAVVMAGGFKTSGKRHQVVIIRRGPDGRPMMRTADLRSAIYNPGKADAVPLRRFDIIYVPRTAIAEVDLFVQQYLRDSLPITFSYAINGQYVTSK